MLLSPCASRHDVYNAENVSVFSATNYYLACRAYATSMTSVCDIGGLQQKVESEHDRICEYLGYLRVEANPDRSIL